MIVVAENALGTLAGEVRAPAQGAGEQRLYLSYSVWAIAFIFVVWI